MAQDDAPPRLKEHLVPIVTPSGPGCGAGTWGSTLVIQPFPTVGECYYDVRIRFDHFVGDARADAGPVSCSLAVDLRNPEIDTVLTDWKVVASTSDGQVGRLSVRLSDGPFEQLSSQRFSTEPSDAAYTMRRNVNWSRSVHPRGALFQITVEPEAEQRRSGAYRVEELRLSFWTILCDPPADLSDGV